jgi:rhodanese-related sulfurtransferase
VTATSATTGTSRILRFPAADPAEAEAHFTRRLAFETDCSDVHDDLALGADGFVVLDVRAAEAYGAGHIPGAVSLPHQTIDERTASLLPRNALFVTYCAGPHCNAATQAAGKLAALGYPVKEMIGGFDYWCRDGYHVET